jgi:hypothetical protein
MYEPRKVFLMPSFAPTVLPPAAREALAGHPTLGGGNLLQIAMASSPDPHVPFIHSHRPLANTDGELQHDFSLAQFDRLAQSWSVWYRSQGVQPGDRVAVWLEDSIAYSLHFYSLAQIGAVAVLINSHASQAIAPSLIEQTGPVGLYTDSGRQAVLAADGGPAGSFWTVTAEELPAPRAASLAAFLLLIAFDARPPHAAERISFVPWKVLEAGSATAESMFVLYWGYYQYVTTAIMEEKQQLKAATSDVGVPSEVGADPGDDDD